jgi:hypothetical protein
VEMAFVDRSGTRGPGGGNGARDGQHGDQKSATSLHDAPLVSERLMKDRR